jgi:hypothetical protein
MRPADQVGAETLEIMQGAPRYNRWQYDRVAPYLGRRICEVGSGIGNMSILLREVGPELLVLRIPIPITARSCGIEWAICPKWW